MSEKRVRITFSCPKKLQELLTKRAEGEGIPRGQLIVELLEAEINTEVGGRDRNPAVNRLIFDIQKRVAHLEGWKREVSKWNQSQDENASNLETAVAYLMNETAGTEADIGKTGSSSKKKGIPSPKK